MLHLERCTSHSCSYSAHNRHCNILLNFTVSYSFLFLSGMTLVDAHRRHDNFYDSYPKGSPKLRALETKQHWQWLFSFTFLFSRWLNWCPGPMKEHLHSGNGGWPWKETGSAAQISPLLLYSWKGWKSRKSGLMASKQWFRTEIPGDASLLEGPGPRLTGYEVWVKPR